MADPSQEQLNNTPPFHQPILNAPPDLEAQLPEAMNDEPEQPNSPPATPHLQPTHLAPIIDAFLDLVEEAMGELAPDHGNVPNVVDIDTWICQLETVDDDTDFTAEQLKEKCTICHEPHTAPCRTTTCLHVFDAECLYRWLAAGSTECPMCRRAMTAGDCVLLKKKG